MEKVRDNSSSNGASVSQKQSHSVLSQFLARAPMAWGGRGKSHPRSLLSDSLLGAQPISSVRRLRHMGEEEVGEETGRGRVVAGTKAKVGGTSKVEPCRAHRGEVRKPHHHAACRGAGGFKAQAGRQAGPRPQSKPCQSLCSESYSSSAPTHLTPSSSMGVPWCRSARQHQKLVSWHQTKFITRDFSLALAGDLGEDPASFKNLLKPVSCPPPSARPALLSLTHDPRLHHHTHTGACVTLAGQQHLLFEDAFSVC